MMNRVATFVITFCAGGLAAINLTDLLEPVRDYDAQWWKVILCVIIALLFNIGEGRKNDGGFDY